MALLLRVVSKPKWVAPDWMPTGDVPADALTDLRADNNELSVWRVEPDQSDLNTALAAMAANRERLDKLDYALIDEAILPGITTKSVCSEGRSPHLAANAYASGFGRTNGAEGRAPCPPHDATGTYESPTTEGGGAAARSSAEWCH
jgi:hypothetical protein